MRNKDVVLAFLEKRAASGSNLYSTGKRLINYNTAIAEWYDNYHLIINNTKYSNSTSRWQKMIKIELFPARGIVDYYINDVDRNTHDLISIYKSNKQRYEILY